MKRIQIWVIYGLLIAPFSLILLINKMVEPLSPSVSFIDLEEMV